MGIQTTKIETIYQKKKLMRFSISTGHQKMLHDATNLNLQGVANNTIPSVENECLEMNSIIQGMIILGTPNSQKKKYKH